MRGTLAGVRRRVERLAGQVRNGCTACRQDEATVRYDWQDERTRHVPRAPKPQVETCAVCGRTYPLQYMVVGWGRGAAS